MAARGIFAANFTAALFVLSGIIGSYGMPQCSPGDQAALLDLKNSFLETPGWAGYFGSWNTSNCCDWVNVECRDSDGRVVNLSIRDNEALEVRDLIPDPEKPGQWETVLASLEALRELSASNVKFGLFPKSLPTSLRSLTFENCDMVGVLPAEVGKLTRLSTLYISGKWGAGTKGSMHLSGEIPKEICSIKNLTSLTLAQNDFTGAIPACIHKLTGLLFLQMYRNKLDEPIPSALGLLPMLESVDLSSNKIPGTIPHSMGKLMMLRHLVLSDNLLTGTIPKEFGALTALAYLDLNGNRLNGHLHPALSQMTLLSYLDVQNNRLCGEIPPSFGNMTKLETLRLRNNRLSGSIPPTLSVFCFDRACSIDLGRNRLTGKISEDFLSVKLGPNSLPGFTNNVEIFLDHNLLEGPLPKYSGNTLRYLNASHNLITGGFPLELASIAQVDLSWNRLDSLEKIGEFLPSYGKENENWIIELRLSHNSLKGYFPAWLVCMMKTVTRLDISWNYFSGALPDAVFDGPGLYELDVSHNYFYSKLPTASYENYLETIYFLDLHHNNFYGTIPSTFLKNRVFGFNKLDLSENRLWGVLPDFFGKRVPMTPTYLDLSDNFFEGPLPLSIGKLPHLIYLDLSNNGFTGEFPTSYVDDLTNLKYFNVSGNSLI